MSGNDIHLSQRQFRFWKGRSTIDALLKVVAKDKKEIERKGKKKGLTLTLKTLLNLRNRKRYRSR